MKIIEAVIVRSALDDFRQCARKLGIFGFDLCEEHSTKLGDHQPPVVAREHSLHPTSRLKVDFAVLDEETKPTVHAVLESVHPDSIGIFKFDQDTRPAAATWRPMETSGSYHSDPSNEVEFTRGKPPVATNPANFKLPEPSPLPAGTP